MHCRSKSASMGPMAIILVRPLAILPVDFPSNVMRHLHIRKRLRPRAAKNWWNELIQDPLETADVQDGTCTPKCKGLEASLVPTSLSCKDVWVVDPELAEAIRGGPPWTHAYSSQSCAGILKNTGTVCLCRYVSQKLHK